LEKYRSGNKNYFGKGIGKGITNNLFDILRINLPFAGGHNGLEVIIQKYQVTGFLATSVPVSTTTPILAFSKQASLTPSPVMAKFHLFWSALIILILDWRYSGK
jgi:hypothetical protein